MILTVAKKEFLLNILTFKYIVGTLMCVVLVSIFTPILVTDYQKRLESYNKNVADNDAELKKVKCYWSLKPTIHRPPTILSIFSRGLEKKVSDSSKIDLANIPIIQPSSDKGNPYLSIFPDLDISLLIRVVMSLLAILMAYDVISGEREQETLKIVFSNPISRYQVILGKYLAGIMTLMVSLLMAFIVVLLILLFNPMVDLTFSDWFRIGLMYFTSVLLVSAMYNIGLIFSCTFRKTSTSLMCGIVCWVFFLFIVPSASQYLASFLHPLESNEKVDGQIAALEEDISRELKDLAGVLTQGDLWGGADSLGGFCYDLCDPRATKYLNECFIHNEPLRIKYAQDVWKIRDRYLKDLNVQRILAENISELSPVSVFGNIMNALANTDYQNYCLYFNHIGDYRNDVVDYIKNKTDNFKSTVYFTPGQTDEERKEFFATMEGRKKHFENIIPLGLDDFPGFVHYPRTIIQSLKIMMFELTVLFLINMLFFTLSFVAFLRCDIR